MILPHVLVIAMAAMFFDQTTSKEEFYKGHPNDDLSKVVIGSAVSHMISLLDAL